MSQFDDYFWRPTTAPTAWRHDDVWFNDAAIGWAVNSNGKIIHTKDGGANWVEQLHLQGTWLRCIGFANDDVGWMGSVTAEDRLYYTRDGGVRWQQVLEADLPAGAPAKICGLSVVDENVVYASGTNEPQDDSALLKTMDGGLIWSVIDLNGHATLLVDNLFINENEGWVVGGKDVVEDPNRPPRREDVKPVVLYTGDGGVSWTNQTAAVLDQFPHGEWGWKIYRLNEQTMFIALESFSAGAILRTDDGGENWRRLEINDQQGNVDLEAIGFVDENTGWVGGWGPRIDGRPSGLSSATVDGGRNWADFQDVGQYLNRFRFLGDPPVVGYASGTSIYKFSDEPLPPIKAEGIAQTVADSSGSKSAKFNLNIPSETNELNIRAFDQFGAKIGTVLYEEGPSPGSRLVEWDFTDINGEQFDPGPYILRVTMDDDSSSFLVTRTKDSSENSER